MPGISEEAVVGTLSDYAAKVSKGTISFDAAVQELDAEKIGESLTDKLIVNISRLAFDVVRQPNPPWQLAIALLSLLHACVDARTKKPADSVLCELAFNFINVAGMAIWHVPDPGIYKQATERGVAAIELIRQQGNQEFEGDLLHALGTLNLDPYAANRQHQLFDQEMSGWRARAFNGETWNHARYLDIESDGYPSMSAALAAAAKYYRESSMLRQGQLRIMTLKALVQTHAHSFMHDLPCDENEAITAAREVLKSIDKDEQPAVFVEIQSYLAMFENKDSVGLASDDFSPAIPGDWLNGSVDRSVKRLGVHKTLQLISYAYKKVKDYPRLLRLLHEAAPLMVGSSLEQVHHVRVIRTFIRSRGADTYDLNAPPTESIEDLFEDVVANAESEDSDPARFAAEMLALADVSVATNEEAFAIGLIDSAIDAAPFATSAVIDSLRYLRANLLLNDAVNAVHIEDWNRSTSRYAEALAAMLDIDAAGRIGELLTRLADVVRLGDSEAVESVCTLLEDKIDSIEVVAGDRVTQQVQSVLENATRTELQKDPDTRVLWRLMQLSCARRFAAMLSAGSAFRVRANNVGQDILQEARVLRDKISKEGYVDTAIDRLADAILLSPHLVHGAHLTGDTATEQLANLEHAYDGLIYESLVATAEGHSTVIADEANIRATLGPMDVLIQYFVIGASENGQVPANLVSALSTQEETSWQIVSFGDQQPAVKMEIDGVAVEVTELSAMVQSIRNHIEEDPDGELLSEDATDAIKYLNDLLMKPLLGHLKKLAQAGKRHLCIVPPGPLAFIPFHFFGAQPATLSESWTITYLPTLQLLTRNFGGATFLRRRDAKVASFGLSFAGNEAGYDELPEAVSEASAVAEAMGSKPFLEDDATEQNLREALLNSQYVHVATHGAQNSIAPSFHKLVLTPDVSDDGDLHAYELLGLDLRGLKLVTLSACETALGRFDRGNNPHGLPAMLMLAGAETVIGTLWEVESRCSERFFTTLYTSLSNENSKLDAYGEALQAARQHYPDFRDWGAFYFLGDWR